MADTPKRDDSGLPGGGKGRRDETTKKGVFPYSAPHPDNIDPELRTPASLTPNAPYDESGRSEMAMYNGQLVGVEPAEPDAKPPEQTQQPDAPRK